jgi:hypothetical protein
MDLSIGLWKVAGLQYYDRPEVLVLKGEEAVEVLQKYVKELEEERPKELTKKQARVMIKLANGLMAAIREEEDATPKPRKKSCVASTLTAVKGRIAGWLHEPPKPLEPSQKRPPEKRAGCQPPTDFQLK